MKMSRLEKSSASSTDYVLALLVIFVMKNAIKACLMGNMKGKMLKTELLHCTLRPFWSLKHALFSGCKETRFDVLK